MDDRERPGELRRQGRLSDAVECCRRLLADMPEDAAVWNELAHALRWQGRHNEARQAALKAVQLVPALAEGWFNLGAALMAEGQPGEAMEAYLKATSLKPDFPEAWSNLGEAHAATGNRPAEIAAYRRAISINPDLAPVWSNLGAVLNETGAYEEAIAACQRAVELDPNFAKARNNLGKALCDHGDTQAAIEAGEHAVRLEPGFAEAWSNLGNAFLAAGRLEESESAHRQAVTIQPGAWKLHFNFGTMYTEMGRPLDAIPHYRRALALDARDAGLHWNLALALLLTGQLAEGWEEYEYRWGRPVAKAPRYDFAAWNGRAEPGLRLLLWSEQGVGDQIIYGGMVPDLLDTPLRVTLEVDPRLVTLFRRSLPGIEVVPQQDPPARNPACYDAQCPIGRLGRFLRPSLDHFPRRHGFLAADAARTEAYSNRLRQDGPGKVVGISWYSANQEFGAEKSSRLDDWAGLLRVSGAGFIDLQYGDTAAVRAKLREHHGLEMAHFDDLDLFGDMEGLAALCAACDLVITVSNVTAHMAGALGKPVWLITPSSKGRIWYWFSGREDSPWYPSMRIFTLEAPGAWREVLDRVALELEQFVAGRNQRPKP